MNTVRQVVAREIVSEQLVVMDRLCYATISEARHRVGGYAASWLPLFSTMLSGGLV